MPSLPHVSLGADAPAEAHTWEELAEYERREVILRLLRRIADSCLRGDHLRVLEREEWECSGTVADGALICTQRLMLFGHVRHRHREALLALTRQMRLHAVRDLDTSVTVGLQPGDAVPNVLVQPLSPSLHTDGYVRWNRVYYAMRCGILQKLHAREEKIRERLRELVQESTTAVPSHSLSSPGAAGGTTSSAAAATGVAGDVSKHGDTLRFYTEEFSRLFTVDNSGGGSGRPRGAQDKAAKEFLPVSEYMAATKETRVSLDRVANNVPTVLVAWSFRYPDCIDWLREKLFDDAHLREVRKVTGLSGRYAVLIDKDPWVAFADTNGGLLPRLPMQRKGFRIDLLRPLPKRAQIVLLNMDEDAAAAQATLDQLHKCLDGWTSPEVDLLSLWAGPEGLQSELATLLNVQVLPFVVQMRPAPSFNAAAATATTTTTTTTQGAANGTAASASASFSPVITHISCNPVEVSKDIYDVPDTPHARDSDDVAAWHHLPVAERTRVAKRCGACISSRRLPLLFTATVTNDYVLQDATQADPWKAITSVASSHVSVLGDAVATHDIAPIAAELRLLHRLQKFDWDVQIMQRSAPLVSSLDATTPKRLLRGETQCVSCAQCGTRLYIESDVHVRCLQCTAAEKDGGALCETCAFTVRCHQPEHFLLRIPAGAWRPSLPLLWGPSNVAPLDLFLNSFVSNASNYHYGVYCDRCRGMIRGTRWKCAVCYQYDLCDACARDRRNALAAGKGETSVSTHAAHRRADDGGDDPDAVPSRHNDATHPMLYVPFAQGAHANKFLQPQRFKSVGEWLDTLES